MKRIKYFVLVVFMFLLNISIIRANEIYSIDVDITLDEEGNGIVTEIWDMKVNKGTENYKPMGDLGNSNITNFHVTDETGREYTYLSNWNINGTLSSKAYKNGFNHSSDGIELCWGMSTYGKHTYTLTYNVSNMIYNVDDAQILYWKLINDNMDPAPKRFSVKISGPNYYEDTLDVWGYGYKGYAYVENGSIYMSNVEDRNFKSNEYAVALVKYPINTFRTDNYTNKFHTFDEVLELAKKGSFTHDYGEKTSTFDIIFPVIMALFQFFFWIFIVILLGKKTSGLKSNYNKKSIDSKNLNYFRDIPCDKDLFKAYFLSEVYNLNRKKEDLLGAIILKWLKDGKVKIIKQEKKKLFGRKRKITAIDLSFFTKNNNTCEDDLYDMMYKASKDGILEENELKKWCSNNYSKFFRWFDKTIEYVRNEYINEGKIAITETGKIFKSKIYNLNDNLYEEATKLAGLKKYLKEFSLINEKEPLEVMLWQEYLIYAQIFGIAKEVAKDFKKLYPELIEQSDYFNYTNVVWIGNISASGVQSASSARTAAQSYSSGGGGFSSGGGGGGSFGGGSGGGCR